MQDTQEKILDANSKMLDFFDVEHVELRVDDNNKIWVNLNGICVLRIGAAGTVHVKVDGLYDLERERDGGFLEIAKE